MKTPKVSFRLPQEQLDKIDLLVKAGIFEDRSVFLRTAIEQLLTDALPEPRKAAQIQEPLCALCGQPFNKCPNWSKHLEEKRALFEKAERSVDSHGVMG